MCTIKIYKQIDKEIEKHKSKKQMTTHLTLPPPTPLLQGKHNYFVIVTTRNHSFLHFSMPTQ